MTEPPESSTDPAVVETVPHEPASSATRDVDSVNRSKKPLLLTGLAVLVVVAAGFTWSGMQTFGNRARAQRMIARAEEENLPKLWKHARVELQEYLQFPFFSGDGDAQLLLAEALIHDESLTHEDAVKEALTGLRKISSEAPQGAQARAKEGKLYLMMVHKLGQAERSLREAIKLNPQDEESHFLLWKLLELTGRADWSEEVFWRVLRIDPSRSPTRPLASMVHDAVLCPDSQSDVRKTNGFAGHRRSPQQRQ